MSFMTDDDPILGDAASVDAIETVVIPRVSDIAGLKVMRALPSRGRRLVGPFIFFDRLGPAILSAGQAVDVPPHPHIGLSTVTYLFDGEMTHKDSLGTDLVIRPGAVNLMTAGRGIVHSERSPEALRGQPGSISGIQTWLALPDGREEIDPSFHHSGNDALPTVEDRGVEAHVVMGRFAGAASPVPLEQETLYVSLRLGDGAAMPIDPEWEERALYVLEGEIEIDGARFPSDRLLVLAPGRRLTIKAVGAARAMLVGGARLGSKRHIWWNFVSSSRERIEAAKEEWRRGRFDIVPGDEADFVPLPSRGGDAPAISRL